MASLTDIREKRKFFVRKKNFNIDDVCPHCIEHKVIMAVKISCDYFIFSDFSATDEDLRARNAIHCWCRSGQAPQCFRSYKDAGFVEP